MSALTRASISLLCSVIVLPIAFFAGFYLLLAIDPHYHDGVSFAGGLVIAAIASSFTFIGVWRKLKASVSVA